MCNNFIIVNLLLRLCFIFIHYKYKIEILLLNIKIQHKIIMDKFNEQNACFNIENFKCYTCKKSYSNIQDFSKHLISIQHEESINYKIGLINLNT